MIDRILVNTPATISNQWYSVDNVTDPGLTTIEIKRADGTVLVAAGTAVTGAGTAPRNFALTSTHTALLDRLTATWTTASLGSATTQVEIVGGFLFTLARARLDSSFDNLSDQQLIDARLSAEQELEDACGVAFVPRYDRELLSGNREVTSVLRRRFIRRVRAVVVDGTALDSTELAKVVPDGNVIYYPNRFNRGVRNVAVDYEHGFDAPPGGAERAALRLIKHYLIPSSFDDRVIAASAGEESFQLSNRYNFGNFTPPRFGIPEIDSFIAANDYRVTVG